MTSLTRGVPIVALLVRLTPTLASVDMEVVVNSDVKLCLRSNRSCNRLYRLPSLVNRLRTCCRLLRGGTGRGKS